jgi:predicted Zn-dependent protease with MMP-like domain
VQTVEARDVRRLLESNVREPTLVLLAGTPQVVSAADLETDDYRGAMVIATQQDLVDQFDGSDISEREVERVAANLNVEINTLGG